MTKYNVSKTVTVTADVSDRTVRVGLVEGRDSHFTSLGGHTLEEIRAAGWSATEIVDLEEDPPGTIRRYRNGDYLYIKAADGEWYRISHTVGTLSNPELTTVES